MSTFALTYGVAPFVYGPLGDRLGKFRLVAWVTLTRGICSVLAVLADSLFERVGSSHVVALGFAMIAGLGLWFGSVLHQRIRPMFSA